MLMQQRLAMAESLGCPASVHAARMGRHEVFALLLLHGAGGSSSFLCPHPELSAADQRSFATITEGGTCSAFARVLLKASPSWPFAAQLTSAGDRRGVANEAATRPVQVLGVSKDGREGAVEAWQETEESSLPWYTPALLAYSLQLAGVFVFPQFPCSRPKTVRERQWERQVAVWATAPCVPSHHLSVCCPSFYKRLMSWSFLYISCLSCLLQACTRTSS